mmetsp:Transcript_21471/g.44756  ORF Transcript_21471/g.44756 Transcript_21471/m.44756 type:complete len:214 (-) Transcript_21471:18-659(-)
MRLRCLDSKESFLEASSLSLLQVISTRASLPAIFVIRSFAELPLADDPMRTLGLFLGPPTDEAVLTTLDTLETLASSLSFPSFSSPASLLLLLLLSPPTLFCLLGTPMSPNSSFIMRASTEWRSVARSNSSASSCSPLSSSIRLLALWILLFLSLFLLDMAVGLYLGALSSASSSSFGRDILRRFGRLFSLSKNGIVRSGASQISPGTLRLRD